MVKTKIARLEKDLIKLQEKQKASQNRDTELDDQFNLTKAGMDAPAIRRINAFIDIIKDYFQDQTH